MPHPCRSNSRIDAPALTGVVRSSSEEAAHKASRPFPQGHTVMLKPQLTLRPSKVKLGNTYPYTPEFINLLDAQGGVSQTSDPDSPLKWNDPASYPENSRG